MALFCLLAPSYAATPITSDPGGGGVGGNAASAPGPSSSYPWVGTVDDTNTGTGNKTAEIPTISWAARGGLKVDLTLYHNSETNFPSPFGYKWLLVYQSQVGVDSSGNVGVTWGDGRKYKFGNTSGVFTPPPGIHEKLIANGSNPVASYDIIEKDQTKYHFANYGGVYVLNTVTDENGNQITVNNSTNGGLISITDSSNRTVTFGYNGPSAGFYNTMTDPLGHVVNLSYDASGNLSQVTYPTLNGAAYSAILGYDANHNVTSIKNMRGNTSTFSYNSADNSLAWAKDNLGNQTTFTYGSPFSYDTTITDPNGNKTIHAYTSGRLAQVSDALGYTEYYTYDTGNNVTQRQDRRGYQWNDTYDGMGNLLTAKDPYGNTSTYTYNAHNKPLTITLPLGRSAAGTYDAADNLTQVQQKDANGNVLATTKLTIGSYGLASDKYDPNGHHTSYTYDANGYLASTTTPLGHKTQWAYDVLGFQTQRVDAMGRTTYYTLDAWERLVTTTYPDSTTNTYGYDASSNLTAFSNYVSPWTRTYDADNRMTGEYIGGTRLVGHTYDASGQKGLLSTTIGIDGRVISYAYSARNELAGVSEASGTETYAYDANGNQTHRYLPNGLRTDQYYNVDNTLQNFYDWDGGNNILASYGWSYNADHQITGYLEARSYLRGNSPTPISVTYGYDPLGHLISDTRTGSYPYATSYALDGAGNRTGSNANGTISTLVHDGDDELTSVSGTGAVGFTYNANGDQITSTINGQPTTYSYDFDDQLVSITKAGSTTVFQYDALGRQANRTVNGNLTAYFLDGEQVLEETTSNWVVQVQYTWGNGLVRRGSEYPMTDGQGTTKLETNSSQSVTSTQETEAFGRAIGGTGSTGSAFGYHGADGYRSDGDGPAGLEPYQKVGARYYDATFGRFITRDTDLSQSPYAYCDGDPVNFSDPSGHKYKKKWPPAFWTNFTNWLNNQPYLQKSTYYFTAADGDAADRESLKIANGEQNIFGFLGTTAAIGGQVSTSQILTAPLTENNFTFGIFGGIALGGAAINSYWSAGVALGVLKAHP